MSIPRTLAHYEVHEKIGAGGMGEVYRARDTKLDRDVALKILPSEMGADPERTRRFEREAKAIAALNHPNIITIFSVEHANGIHFLTMELVDGGSLDNFIPAEGLPVKDLLKYALPLCDAVASAHEQGITHRDLKPQNVMVDSKGRLKVLDFGLAKAAPPSPGSDSATQAMVTQTQGQVMGTVNYMSPEQAQGMDVDPRSDVFSLGIMLYEMATGERPFKGDTSISTITSILRDEPLPIHELRPQTPPELSRIQRRALAKDVERRYQTALGLRNDLQVLKDDLQEDTGSPIDVAGDIQDTERGKGSRLIRIAVPASVLAALLVVLFVLKPFKLDVAPDQPASASEGALAVLDFKNLVDPEDPERLGQIVTNLITTGLGTSEYLSLVSNQRLYDLVQGRGEQDRGSIDRESAGDLALQAGASTMLLGSILKISPHYVITSQLVSTGTGRILKSQQVNGEPGEDIFALVDRLSAAVREDLGVPMATQDADVSVASVTTRSMEAYRLYLSGVEHLRRLEIIDARKDLEMAVTIDSTFAMAHYQLSSESFVQIGSMAKGEQQDAARRAADLVDRVTQRERHYILSRAAVLAGRHDEAIAELETLVAEFPDETPAYALLADLYGTQRRDMEGRLRWLHRWVEIDPGDKSAYNALAYAYPIIGNFEKAIWALNQYIQLAPDEANPYDTRGDYYAMMGDLEKGKESFEAAIQRDASFLNSYLSLANILNELGDKEGAKDVCLGAIKNAPDAAGRSIARIMLANIPARSGRLVESIEVLDAGMRADEMDGYGETWYRWKLGARGRMHHHLGDYDRADADLRESIALGMAAEDGNTFMPWASLILSLIARGELETAETELAGFKGFVEQVAPSHRDTYWICRGLLELKRGNPGAAFPHFQQARKTTHSMFWVFYGLGVGHLALGRAEDAVRELELVTRGTHWSERDSPVQSVLAHYYLGMAYEAAQRPDDAAAQYEHFLDTFREADPVFGEVDDARKRLDRLRPGS